MTNPKKLNIYIYISRVVAGGGAKNNFFLQSAEFESTNIPWYETSLPLTYNCYTCTYTCTCIYLLYIYIFIYNKLIYKRLKNKRINLGKIYFDRTYIINTSIMNVNVTWFIK